MSRTIVSVLPLLVCVSSRSRAADANPAEWVGAAAAARADVAVVWSARDIRRINDGKPILRGAETSAPVSVSPEGLVFAVREQGMLGIAQRDGRERWRSLVPGRIESIQFLAKWTVCVVWREEVGHALLLSADRGKTWSEQTLPRLDEARLHLRSPNGEVDLIARSHDGQSGDYTRHYRGRLGGTAWREVVPNHRYSESLTIGHDGQLYDYQTVSGPEATFAVRPSGSRPLLRLTRGRESVIESATPAGLRLAAVDHRGHPLGLREGELWRWSPHTHWQRLSLKQHPEQRGWHCNLFTSHLGPIEEARWIAGSACYRTVAECQTAIDHGPHRNTIDRIEECQKRTTAKAYCARVRSSPTLEPARHRYEDGCFRELRACRQYRSMRGCCDVQFSECEETE